MAVRLDFTRAVGRGSKMQVDDFILLMTVSTSCSVTLEKWLRDLEDPGIGSGRVVGVS